MIRRTLNLGVKGGLAAISRVIPVRVSALRSDTGTGADAQEASQQNAMANTIRNQDQGFIGSAL